MVTINWAITYYTQILSLAIFRLFIIVLFMDSAQFQHFEIRKLTYIKLEAAFGFLHVPPCVQY